MGHCSRLYIIIYIITHVDVDDCVPMYIVVKFIIIASHIIAYPCISSSYQSLYIRPLQSVYCTQWDIVFSPFQSRHHAPNYIMNTDIRSMDSPIVVMLRKEFYDSHWYQLICVYDLFWCWSGNLFTVCVDIEEEAKERIIQSWAEGVTKLLLDQTEHKHDHIRFRSSNTNTDISNSNIQMCIKHYPRFKSTNTYTGIRFSNHKWDENT